MARRLNLRGRNMKLGIIGVGGHATSIDSCLYTISLVDKAGKSHAIEVYGIERISSVIESVDKTEIARLLGIQPESFSRPESGEVDILVGMQYASLHPVRIQNAGNLLLMENQFGYVVAGCHSALQKHPSFTQSCMQARTALVMHVSGFERFFEVEGLGVRCDPPCGGCKCGTCQPGGKQMSLKDEHEYQMIDKGLSFDDDTGRWVAEYPWIRSPSELPNNRHVALAIMKSLERRLLPNKPLADLYNQQIQDMKTRGAAREVTDQELVKYVGPKFYIAHHAVFKPSSKSTPCRIVFNSSLQHLGHSLNEYLAKGPSLLNNLLGILLRFREGRFAFIGDISKMFHSIDIGLKDQMTHLYLWRDCNLELEPKTFAMTVVNMGDRPSATIAQVALRKTAHEFSESHPTAANIIRDNSYMDDILNSVNSTQEIKEQINDIETILASRGFKLKEWICSNMDQNVKILMNTNPADAENALGVKWTTENDCLMFPLDTSLPSYTVTKRNVLSNINKVFDPIGLLAPFTVKLKIMMRKLWSNVPKIEWDDQVPQILRTEWQQLLSELTEIEHLKFPRALTPLTHFQEPILVIFSDGSQQAYGAVAYVRWKTDAGFKVFLIASKTRMAPLKVIDIVKLELCGAVLSKRLRETVEAEMRIRFTKVVHLVDSEIVHAMVKKESYGFNTFAANRIGEIQQTTSPDDWHWIAGKPWLNIADLTTRGCTPNEIGIGSIWQNGPDFLLTEEHEWPTRQDIHGSVQIPDELQKKFVGSTKLESETLSKIFNVSQFSKWRILVRTTARMIRLVEQFRSKTPSMEPSLQNVQDAEALWIKEAQGQIDINANKKLMPVIENGILVVGGRTERWMQATWNKQKFILLPHDHHVSLLIARYEHKKGGHLGVEATIAKIRSIYWIIGIRKLVRAIVRRCVKCKAKLKNTCKQIMSPLPEERLRPSPPFTHIGVDYIGPYTIKGEVQKRVRGKTWCILITCLTARSVYIDICRDYTTDAFLEVFRRFACMRGWPKTAYSDNAGMIAAASNELKKIVSDLDWEKIMNHGVEMKMEWSFPPADAPWYNGATEALVKTTKRALNAAIGENVLSFSEFQTVVFEAGQLVNQRPIGRVPSSPDDGSYLCPNDLLLGRASPTIPQGPFETRSSLKYRLDFVQGVVDSFWKRWTREVFPSLVIQTKWHTETRNLCKGDVVLVQDSNVLRGEWKMALVEEPRLSKDGRVRKVLLSYRTPLGSRQEIERPVQRLILLVPVDNSS